MAAAGDPKGFKQDMVVSIRYRNDLPPPPMPPKFLEIDNGGLAQYLTTSFASAMARREEPNIEVDAEGGMPIDMIGIPGYFLGDESGMC
jgi:RNA polymerase II-associated factor 1